MRIEHKPKKPQELFNIDRFTTSSYKLKSEYIEKELKIQAEKADLRRELQMLKRQHEDESRQSKKEIVRLEEMLKSGYERETSLKREVDSLNAKIDKVLKYANALDESLTREKKLSEKLTGERDDLSARLKSALLESEMHLSEKTTRLKAVEEEKAADDRLIERLREETTELNGKLSAASSENTKLSREITNLKGKLEGDAVSSHEKEKRSSELLVAAEAELRRAKDDLEKANNSIEHRIEASSHDLKKQLEQSVKAYAMQGNELRQIKEHAGEEARKKDDEIKTLKDENDALRRDAAKMRETRRTLSEKMKQSSDQDSEHLRDELQMVLNKSRYEKGALEEELKHKEKAAADAEDKAEMKIRELTLRIKTLMEEFNRNERVILKLQDSISEEQHKASVIKSTYELKLKELDERTAAARAASARSLKGDK